MEVVEEGNRLIHFEYDGIFEEILDQLGQMPLPPYITHQLQDKDRYNTAVSYTHLERGDKNGQAASYSYPTSDLPCAKVCIAGDANGDGDIDWNDGALAFRDIMNIAQGAELSLIHI